MLIIHHRRNSLKLLKQTSSNLGVEVDIRSYGKKLIVNHEPFVDDISFSDWLEGYKHKFLILNIKEEGIENKVLDLIKKNQINDFFLIDQSFPFLIKTANSGESRIAVRVSEFEPIETALSLVGLIQWVWLDIFNNFSLTQAQFKQIKEAGLKICLVSPELQGHQLKDIFTLQNKLNELDIELDAVCTKNPKLWLGTK